MSGVAKDDTNPVANPDETAAAAGVPDGGHVEADTAAYPAKDDGESRARRSGVHLRVVTDDDPVFSAPPPAPAPAAPQRIGQAIRAARENAGFTLEHVSRETRVHLSHLRAIEDMTPGLLGAPVYAKGYIRTYARFLGLDEQTTLERWLSECGAILKDPEKPEIAPPATSKARKLPVAIPVLGILVVGLIGAGAAMFLANGDKGPASDSQAAAQIDASAATVVPAPPPQLRIVALKHAMLEVRSAKGDKYVHRVYAPGEFFVVRVGAGYTVTVEDGAAFEWRLGDQSLGLLQAEGGPVFSQSVDQAALRQPVAVEPPPVQPAPDGALTPNGDPARPAATPPPAATTRPAAARPPATSTPGRPAAQPAAPPAASSQPPARPQPAAEPAPPARDPALDAYPDQAPPSN